MSVHDRTTPTAARRWLGRALVVAGAAVAGTSAALLSGQPAQADPDESAATPAEAPAPSEASPLLESPALSALTDETAGLPEAALEQLSPADPASFPLDRIDPLTLVPAPPVGHALTGDLDDESTAPAEEAPELDATAPPTEPATASAAAAPDRQASGPRSAADNPVPATGPSAASAQVDGSARTTGQPGPAAPRHTPEPELPPRDSTPPASALPASTGCAKTADGPQQGTGLPGWHPAVPRAGDAGPDACSDDRDRVLRGVPAPQPGATPD